MHAFGLSSVSLPVFASFRQPAASRMQAMKPEALGTRSQPGREVKPFGAGCKAAYRAYRSRALQPACGLARICQAPTARVRSLPFASRSQTPSRF